MKKLLSTLLGLCMVLVASSQLPNMPTNGLIAYYPLNNGYGYGYNDISGNAYHLQTTFPLGFSTDRFGNASGAAAFNGASGVTHKYNYTSATAAFQKQSFMLGAWVKLTSMPNDFAYITALGSNDIFLRFYKTGGSYYIQAGYRKGTSAFAIVTQGIVLNDYLNTWRFISMSRDASNNTLYLSVNGTVLNTTYDSNPVVYTAADKDFKVGYYTDVNTNFLGSIADVMYYDRLLTTTEAMALMQCSTPRPQNTTAPTAMGICTGGSTTLSASATPATNTIKWYTSPLGGSPINTGTSYAVSPSATTTYYLDATVPGTNGCISYPRFPMTVTVSNGSLPATPTNTTPSWVNTCGGTSSTISASSPGNTINWFDVPTGGTSLGTGNSFTTPPLPQPSAPNAPTTVTYYAEASNQCGPSPRLAITLNVRYTYSISNTTPIESMINCPGDSVTFSVVSNAPAIEWIHGAGYFTMGTGNTLTVNPFQQGSGYIAQAGDGTTNTCNASVYVSSMTASPSSTAPTNTTPAGSLTICPGNTTTLTFDSPNGGIALFDQATGGNMVGASASSSGNTFYVTTPVLTNTTTFYAQSGIGACASPRTPVTVTTTVTPVGTIVYVNDTIKSTNLFNSYVLKKNGVVISSSNTTGSFAIPITECGDYRAEFTNTLNNCPNISATASYASGACGTTLSFGTFGPQFPLLYSFSYGTPAGEPSILDAANPLVVTTACQAGLYNIRIKSATGCYYNFSYASGSLAGGPFSISSTSNSDTVTTCTIYSNIVSVAPAGPSNTTAASALTICSGQTTTLSASGAGTLQWFTQATGGNAVGIGSTFTTPTLTANTTYYVQSVNGGCTSARTAIAVTVGSQVSAPTNTSTAAATAICSGNSTTLSVSAAPANHTTFWSTSSTGSSPFATGNSTTIPATSLTNTTTFYVGYTNSITGCNSALTPITVTVNATPAAPSNTTTAANQTVCSGNTATLTVSGTGTINWYTLPTGGTSIASGSSYTTPTITTSVTYYAAATSGACSSTRTAISVTANPTPATPSNTTATANLTVCSGSTTTLSASTTTSGASLKWYSVATGGTALATAATYTTPALTSNTTYYVEAATASCTSSRTAITVTVTPTPTAPSNTTATAALSVCNGSTTVLTATASGSIRWYNVSTGGTVLSTGSSFTTPAITANTTYYAENLSNSCVSARTPIAVTVKPVPTLSGGNAVCIGSSIALSPSIAGGVWTSSNAAFATVSNGSVTGVAQGTATITYDLNGCTTTQLVTVNTLPVASISGPSTICSGLTVDLSASGGGSYQWSSGLGSNATVSVSPTTTTTYTVTVTNGNNCSSTASQTVNVQATPTAVISGPSQLCVGETATLVASGGTSYAWTNGLGNSASISVSPTTTTTYEVTVSLGANCNATTTQTVVVNQPSTTQLTQTICEGSSYLFDGNNLSIGGNYVANLSNIFGCDSTVNLSLSVTPAPVSLRDTLVCDGTVFSFGNNTISQAGQYNNTVQTLAGCDSIVQLNVQYLAPIATTLDKQICVGQSYEFNGQQLNTSDQYTATFASASGCDSVVTLNLAVVTQLTSSANATICEGESFAFAGQNLSSEGVFTGTFPSSGGCDSVVTLTLTVTPTADITVSLSAFTLTAADAQASYQWVDCSNNQEINGETAQSFSPTVGGSYAVILTKNGCAVQSACTDVYGMGIADAENVNNIRIFPNPASYYVSLENVPSQAIIKIMDVTGKVLYQTNSTASSTQLDVSAYANGIYVIQVEAAKQSISKKVVISK